MKVSCLLIMLLIAGKALASYDIDRAKDFYNNGKYVDAIKLYEKLLQNGFVNGKIYFNLGNSYFREGQLGKAIFYYRLAEKERPRDGDVKYNLKFSRDKTKDKIDLPTADLWKRIIPFSFNESLWQLFIFSLLFWPVFILSRMKKHASLKLIRNISFIFMVVATYNLLVWKFFYADVGVAIKPNVTVFSGIGKDNIVLFSLTEGAEFEVRNTKNAKWAQIQISKDKKGWVQKRDIIF